MGRYGREKILNVHAERDGRGAILFCCQERFTELHQEDGMLFQLPDWNGLVHGVNDPSAPEEGIENLARDAGHVFKAWIEAGGKTRADESVAMEHR